MTNDLNDLERDIMATQEKLGATIDQLLYRSNPKVIVNREVTQVKSKFVDLDTGAPKTDAILRAAGIAAGVLVGLIVLRKLIK